jgi:uncharacterized membrane protein YccC
MRDESGMSTLRTTIRNRAVELRLCCRVTVAALATYALAEFLNLPLVLWAVLTAIILSQLSVGRTLKATIDYFVGTLGGAVFSSLVATLIPHSSELGILAVLGIALAPLAAIRPSFAVAPFTAVLVLLVPLTHASPLDSAYYRVIEVGLGAMTAILLIGGPIRFMEGKNSLHGTRSIGVPRAGCGKSARPVRVTLPAS